jgi:hypothetical protein
MTPQAAMVLIQIFALQALGLCAGLALLALSTWFDEPPQLNLRGGDGGASISPEGYRRAA